MAPRASELASSQPVDERLETFVARQPILDNCQNVYAYELLYRSGWKDGYDSSSSARATTDVVLSALLEIGMERLAGGKLAFVNFDREVLLGELAGLLPSRIVIEVLESVVPDQEVVTRCHDLKKQGFRLALDDVTDLSILGELITVADFIKVDFRATDRPQQELLAKQAIKRGIRPLAEKVETAQEFEWALRVGYTLVQGYFFARPKIVRGSKIPLARLALLRLVNEANKMEPDLARLEDALKREPTLVFKLLRYLNSAMFAWEQPIGSIRHALALLGTDQIRKWVALLALSTLSERTPPSLMPLAIVRARFCELIAAPAGLKSRSSELFLFGMLSLFEAILGRPMDEIIENIDLNEDIADALLSGGHGSNPVAVIYSLITAYESGLWTTVDNCAKVLGLSRQMLSEAYSESVRWAEDVGKI